MNQFENKKKSHAEKAEELFRRGFNCSQSVFASFAEDYGIDQELALKLSASFGGGMGRMREVCGAFSGILMINGLENGCIDGTSSGKAVNYDMVQHLAKEYKELSGGSIICRELLGLDRNESGKISDSEPHPTKRTEGYYQKRPCVELIKGACEIIEKEFDFI